MRIEHTSGLPWSVVVGGMARFAIATDGVVLALAARFVLMLTALLRAFVRVTIAVATRTKRKDILSEQRRSANRVVYRPPTAKSEIA